MNDSRGSWYLLTGIVIGLSIGIIWGWFIAPVQYTETEPETLRAEYREEYKIIIALAYAANGDLARAQSRLNLFSDPNPALALSELAGSAASQNAAESEIEALNQLAKVANTSARSIPTAIPLPISQTIPPEPTNTTIPTIVPTEISTSTPEPTSTPVPATSTPANTPTPVPDATDLATDTVIQIPSPTQNNQNLFILDSRILTCSPGPLLIIRTRDATGSGVAGVEIILNWPGQEEHIFTGLKPEFGPGYADFEMEPGITYTLRLADGSQLITDIKPEECESGSGEMILGTLELTFIQP